MTALRVSFILTLLSAAAAQALAQGDGAPPAGDGRGRRAAAVAARETHLRMRARDIAAATADEAVKWDDKKAAVRVISQAADLLWAGSPERSRGWLLKAWELAGGLSRDGGKMGAVSFRTSSPRTQARATVLAVAQKHDQRLADSLLRQLGDEKEESGREAERGVFDDRSVRSRQLLSLALNIADSDPATAAALAQRSLADGISFQLQAVLLALRRGDRSAADRVFDSALDRLATGFTDPSEGQVLASYLFTPGRVVGSAGDGTTALAVSARTSAPRSSPAEEDRARARRFLAIMQRALLTLPAPSTTANPARAAQEFITLSGSLAQPFKLYAPELWPAIEHRAALVTPDLAPAPSATRLTASVRERLKSAAEAGADEARLDRLHAEMLAEYAEQETDPVARKLAFVQAALATAPEDLDGGRRLADKIEDSQLRAQVVSQLVYHAALASVSAGRAEEAVGLAAEALPAQRAVILIAAAQRMAHSASGAKEEQNFGRRARALEVLTDAERAAERVEQPGAAHRIRFGLSAVLAPLDATRSLAAFGDAVTAASKDDAFEPADNSAPRAPSLSGASPPSPPVVRGGYGIKDAATALARIDFEGLVAHASRLSAPPVRGACLLEIARAVLTQPPTK